MRQHARAVAARSAQLGGHALHGADAVRRQAVAHVAVAVAVLLGAAREGGGAHGVLPSQLVQVARQRVGAIPLGVLVGGERAVPVVAAHADASVAENRDGGVRLRGEVVVVVQRRAARRRVQRVGRPVRGQDRVAKGITQRTPERAYGTHGAHGGPVLPLDVPVVGDGGHGFDEKPIVIHFVLEAGAVSRNAAVQCARNGVALGVGRVVHRRPAREGVVIGAFHSPRRVLALAQEIRVRALVVRLPGGLRNHRLRQMVLITARKIVLEKVVVKIGIFVHKARRLRRVGLELGNAHHSTQICLLSVRRVLLLASSVQA